MASSDYHFITHWRVAGTVEEVVAIIGDAADLPRWWPAVYLDTQLLEPGGPDGVGRTVELFTKGWLPYTLRWRLCVTESDPPQRIALEAWGDFVGRGVWSFAQQGDVVAISYDWRIRADKPLLRSLSFLLKPVFAVNHRWAMARGEESLALELRRRRAQTEAERAAVPPPPGPTFAPRSRRPPLPERQGLGMNPAAVACYEAAGWAAYYNRDWLGVVWLMVCLNRRQFGMSWLEAAVAAVDIARAAAAFAPAANDLAATRHNLTRYFARARRTADIHTDAATLAECELEYWVVHRTLAERRKANPADNDLAPLVASLARLHAAIFDTTPERMQVSAALRALAAARVDDITAGISTDVMADWVRIQRLLHDAYRAAHVLDRY
jgi:hypothetical protein